MALRAKYILPDFTDTGYKIFQDTLVTLGKKTKAQFTQEIIDEAADIITETHQMMTAADVTRIAAKYKI